MSLFSNKKEKVYKLYLINKIMVQTYQYTRQEFESFARAVKRASDMVRAKKPDFIFAPIIGAVPLIDLLSIADRHFRIETTEYPPNSSRFSDREGIMNRWYSNFLHSNYVPGQRMSILCIDEVISGSSAVKGYNEFRRALAQFGESRGERLERRITYEILGFGEKPKGDKRNHGFSSLVNSKKARVLETDNIITSDNPLFNPIKLKVERSTGNGRFIYKPEIEGFEYSEDYLNLLREFAEYFGRDPESTSPGNLIRIQESLSKYLKQNA